MHGAIAYVRVFMQAVLCLGLLLMAQRINPDYVVVSELMDETQHNTSMRLGRSDVDTVAHFLVYVCTLCVIWPGCPPIFIRLTPPPTPITSTSAKSMWDALHTHEFLLGKRRFMQKLLATASKAAARSCFLDDASSNGRLYDHELSLATE